MSRGWAIELDPEPEDERDRFDAARPLGFAARLAGGLVFLFGLVGFAAIVVLLGLAWKALLW